MIGWTNHRRVKQTGGFTLLEMVFVLAFVAILVTWLTLSIGTVETEQRLRSSVSEVGVMAKRARNVAVTQQRAYQVIVEQGKISMSPQYARSEGADGGIEENTNRGSGQRFDDVTASEELDAEVEYEIRRWGSDEWVKIDRDQKVVMTIDPTGLVEPISIRCTLGDSWIKQDLHPLTADVRDEETSISKE